MERRLEPNMNDDERRGFLREIRYSSVRPIQKSQKNFILRERFSRATACKRKTQFTLMVAHANQRKSVSGTKSSTARRQPTDNKDVAGLSAAEEQLLGR